jgi:peptidoglycan-associated lipoprotein
MNNQIKKIATTAVALTIILSATSSCSLFKKKTDGADNSALGSGNSSIKTETTADGGSEKIDASPMNFSAQGSDSGSIEGLKTVFFEYDKSVLSGAEKAKLEGNVAWMKSHSGSKLSIEGHCDQRGSNEYNLSLGERRANAVKQMFTQMGIAADRLTTVSFGEEKPLIQGENDSAMSKNRRANFVPAN